MKSKLVNAIWSRVANLVNYYYFCCFSDEEISATKKAFCAEIRRGSAPESAITFLSGLIPCTARESDALYIFDTIDYIYSIASVCKLGACDEYMARLLERVKGN